MVNFLLQTLPLSEANGKILDYEVVLTQSKSVSQTYTVNGTELIVNLTNNRYVASLAARNVVGKSPATVLTIPGSHFKGAYWQGGAVLLDARVQGAQPWKHGKQAAFCRQRQPCLQGLLYQCFEVPHPVQLFELRSEHTHSFTCFLIIICFLKYYFKVLGIFFACDIATLFISSW